MQKRCICCNRIFKPDKRVGDKQKVCKREACKRERKRRAQGKWVKSNPEYFSNHYTDYVKPWRQKRRQLALARIKDKSRKVIKDELPPSEAYQELVLLIPESINKVIKDEIRLRRVDISTFTAYGP